MARKEIRSEITGSVWKVLVTAGDRVGPEDPLLILESMKMEIPVIAEVNATVIEIHVQEGQALNEGALLAVVES
jgi:acetyl-CoA carboxylase biotin carboxyl carrier protein